MTTLPFDFLAGINLMMDDGEMVSGWRGGETSVLHEVHIKIDAGIKVKVKVKSHLF